MRDSRTVFQDRVSSSRRRVLAGVLWAGEPQLKDSIASLFAQQSVDLGYFVIAGRAKRDAHNLLYAAFERYGPQFDAMLKLDADMVIRNSDLLKRACDQLLRSTATLLLIPVHDYFTDAPMIGLHVYRSGMRWSTRTEDLFTDINDLDAEQKIVSDLGGARLVDHCPDPDEYQAFHFGIHRGLKLRRALDVGDDRYANIHVRTMGLLARAARLTRHRARVVAYLGFAMALDRQLQPTDISYASTEIRSSFDAVVLPSNTDALLGQARRAARHLTLSSPAFSRHYITRLAKSSARKVLGHGRRT